jgi:hypothetical protein
MKDETIKVLNKENLTLVHRRGFDDFGILRDYFQMKKLSMNPKDKGAITIKPFFGLIKVKSFHPEDPITTTTDYTEKEYEEMFEKNKF